MGDQSRGARAASQPAREESRARIRAEAGRPLVLVVDDDEETRGALVRLLGDEGYAVVEAADGAAALEHLAAAADGDAQVPDVLLLDFVMPRLSGLGMLRLVRRFARAPTTILMTAFPDRSVESFARGLGALRVLHKPIDADALLDAVRAAVSEAKSGA